AEAGARVSMVITATLFGMALGGWMSGEIFDLTGSYRAAFVNGLMWNLVNVSIATWLLRRSIGRLALARGARRRSGASVIVQEPRDADAVAMCQALASSSSRASTSSSERRVAAINASNCA